MDNRSTWIITDGATGNLKQCQALCHYLKVSPRTFNSKPRVPGNLLAPRGVWLGSAILDATLQDALADQTPRLLVTAGRQSALLSRVIGTLPNQNASRIHLLNPRIDPAHFDLVITPEHDGLQGSNVLQTVGSLNTIDADSLTQAASQWSERLGHLPSPRRVILIGGSTRAYAITRDKVAALAQLASRQLETHGGSILVSLAPRSEARVQAAVNDYLRPLAADMWQGESENPYMGYLAFADFINVTPDSINMVSEACAVGVPVVADFSDIQHVRFRRFFDYLEARGLIRAFADDPGDSPPAPLRETRGIAQEVGRRLSIGLEA